MMHNRARGDAVERRLARKLRGEGWYVIRSGGSMGAADLIAINEIKKEIMLIQCKILKEGYLAPGERARIENELGMFVGDYKLNYKIHLVKSKPRTFSEKEHKDKINSAHKNPALQLS